MYPQENSFQPLQFLLLVGVPVASVLLLAQCLRWHCPRRLLGTCQKPGAEEDAVCQPTPLPENETSSPCPPVTLSEMAAFYQELNTPTQGHTVTRQLMNKLLLFSVREVDHRGGCLILQDTGISLLIPPGAVPMGRQERVSLVLVWDLSDAPSLSKNQGLVSPVVACGPHGATFLKPCTLTFKHCAQQPSQARTYSSNTSLLDVKAWRALGRPGAYTSRDECRIPLSHFRAVYLPSTSCQPIDETRATSGINLKCGWENVDDSSCQLVPHLHIWHGKCPFRSFCFRKKANESEDCSALTNEIIVTMHTFQDGLETRYMEIVRFQASEEESWAAAPPVSQPPPCNRLPPELFEQLQMLLEPNSITGNDWRRLASHLGLCGMKIRFLSCQRSPAAAILELFQEQNGSLQELHYLMTSMERLDCASAIQNYLSGKLAGSPAPSPRLAQDNQGLELDEKL
ncbi:UNC5C-like protein [Echinops telfairi]|uniref:UNC5C-like protein n=1 Tax=Echinops telfairi TaxID=9371 RepID=A0ABM0IYL4_ECHTE|nr:UNC5C-like protein [Echinops telfairi]